MREIRSSESVEGIMSNHDPYSDSEPWLCYAMSELCGELLKFERLLLPLPSMRCVL